MTYHLLMVGDWGFGSVGSKILMILFMRMLAVCSSRLSIALTVSLGSNGQNESLSLIVLNGLDPNIK